MYNKTKEEDYNTDVEKDRIKSKKESFVVIERNSSTRSNLSDEELIGSYDELSTTDEIEYENVDQSWKRRDRSKKINLPRVLITRTKYIPRPFTRVPTIILECTRV